MNAAVWSPPSDNPTSMNLQPIGVTQSQGDQGFVFGKDSLDTVENQFMLCSPDLTDLNFLDSVIEENETSDLGWQSKNMNIDLKDLLSDVLSDETDVSSLLDFNNLPSEISEEQSYNWNMLKDFSGNHIHSQDAQSCETFSSEVSSTSLDFPKESALDSDVSCSMQSGSIDQSIEKESLAGRKYLEMRKKNNLASQRSRKMRKQKDSEMAIKLKNLEKENKDLLLLAQKLEKERDALQKKLMTIFSRK